MFLETKRLQPPNGMEADLSTITPAQSARVHIRWMIRRDLSEVLTIEDSNTDFPWNESLFLRCLRQRNCIGMVAEKDGCILGFMIYELHKYKLQILNLAVHPDFQRQAIASQMICKLKSKLSEKKRTCIVVELRETQLSSHLFFQSQSFTATDVLRNHFTDSDEDAYLMQFSCAVPAETENVTSALES